MDSLLARLSVCVIGNNLKRMILFVFGAACAVNVIAKEYGMPTSQPKASSSVSSPTSKGEIPNTAIVPTPKLEDDFYDWYARHNEVKTLIKSQPVDLVFLGCSITHLFGGLPLEKNQPCSGAETWAKYYAKRNAVNMGFGYDRTQNVLWRLENGELDGIEPKVVVLMIGSNNLRAGKARQNTPEEIAEGIEAICEKIHAKIPKCKVLLMGVMPRKGNQTQPPDVYVKPILELNKHLAELAGRKDYIVFLDLRDKLAGADGLPCQEFFLDTVHPNAKGYQTWAETMEPVLVKLLGEK